MFFWTFLPTPIRKWWKLANEGTNGKEYRGSTKENIRKACDNFRRCAGMRPQQTGTLPLTVFHYNGHDVPRPTENGEIWLFSENMEQYHPMALSDLAHQLGSAIYIWDCCQAGLVVEKFYEVVQSPQRSFHFAACGRDEFRPIRSDIPGTCQTFIHKFSSSKACPKQ